MRWGSRHFNDGWRGRMIRVAFFSTVLWLINMIVYVILLSKCGAHSGSGLLMERSCGSVQRANTGTHAVLNIVTSLMLSASNFAMVSLCSPTREEIDAAHDKKEWLSIGGMGLRNFRLIKTTRAPL